MFRRGPLTHIASDFRKKRLDRRRLKSGDLGQINTVNFKEICSGSFRWLMVLPRAMLDSSGELTLDDYPLSKMEQELGVPVVAAETLGELLGFGEH